MSASRAACGHRGRLEGGDAPAIGAARSIRLAAVDPRDGDDASASGPGSSRLHVQVGEKSFEGAEHLVVEELREGHDSGRPSRRTSVQPDGSVTSTRLGIRRSIADTTTSPGSAPVGPWSVNASAACGFASAETPRMPGCAQSQAPIHGQREAQQSGNDDHQAEPPSELAVLAPLRGLHPSAHAAAHDASPAARRGILR